MSRAFVKEDVDPPERSGRARTASGLPPGAANYMTTRGIQKLRDELAELRRDAAANEARIAHLKNLLASVTAVEPADDPNNIAFGAKVTVRDAVGHLRSYRIVGVDELELYADAVSWISSIGRALLAAEIGERVNIGNDRVEVAGVKYSA